MAITISIAVSVSYDDIAHGNLTAHVTSPVWLSDLGAINLLHSNDGHKYESETQVVITGIML